MKKHHNSKAARTISAALAICCMTAALSPAALLNVSAAYSTGTYTVSGQSANIRQNPGTDVVGYAEGGASFNVSRVDGSWGYSASIPATSGSSVAGWVYLENCTLKNASAAAGFAAGSKIEITNTPEVNFRSGAGTGYSMLGKIPKGTVLTVSEVSGGWVRVSYGGQSGWISTDYCKAYTEPSAPAVTSKFSVGEQVEVTNTDQVNYRTGPSTGYQIFGSIPRGTVLKVDEVSGSWLRVAYNGQSGWISSTYCKKYTAPAPSENTSNAVAAVGDKVEITNTDKVNFRSGAGTGYQLIGSIPKGAVVTVSEVSGKWFRVTYDGLTGWFSSGYCKKYVEPSNNSSASGTVAEGEKIKVTAYSAVYMRTGAGASYDLMGTVPTGSILTVIEEENGWYRVKYDGKTGWITSLYTEKYTETPSTETPVQPPAQTTDAIKAGDKVKITAFHAVNLRTGAGTSYNAIGTIKKGEIVTVTEVSNGWYRTEFNGKTGWFVGQYCEKYTENSTPSEPVTPEQQPTAGYQVNDTVRIRAAVGVYLRTGSGTSFDVIATVPDGALLKVTEVSGTWLKVTYKDKTGWITSRYCLKEGEASSESTAASGKVTIGAGVSVCMRMEPNTSSKVIAYVKGGREFEYTDKSGGWYKIIYNGKTGWVSGMYAKEL